MNKNKHESENPIIEELESREENFDDSFWF